MDHDRLFKELLTTFFVEFLDLFLPDIAAAPQAAPPPLSQWTKKLSPMSRPATSTK